MSSDRTGPNQMIERLHAHPLVYQGRRCVTFRLIDQMHDRPEGSAKDAFTRHREELKEGKHYYSLPLKEFRQLGMSNIPNSESSKRGNPNRHVYLITERGYLMIVKPFNDKRAWEVQDELIDGYFRREEQASPASGMDAVAQVMGHVATVLGNVVSRLERLEQAGGRGERQQIGPRFVICDRLNELLEIHQLQVKDAWKESVKRRINGEAGLLGIPIFQARERGVIEMPREYQPWAEQVMLQHIRQWLERTRQPLFAAKGGEAVLCDADVPR